ncbi:hypothetical protein ACLX1H_004822 [Fusarium chlamydosporum]
MPVINLTAPLPRSPTQESISHMIKRHLFDPKDIQWGGKPQDPNPDHREFFLVTWFRRDLWAALGGLAAMIL